MRTNSILALSRAVAVLALVGCGSSTDSSDDPNTGGTDGTDGTPPGGFTFAPPALDNSGTPSEWLAVDDRKQLSGLDQEELDMACTTLLGKLADRGDGADIARTECLLNIAFSAVDEAFSSLGGGDEPIAVPPLDGGTADGGMADGGTAADGGMPTPPAFQDPTALVAQVLSEIDVAACEAEVNMCQQEIGSFFDPQMFKAFCQPALRTCNRSAADFDTCQNQLASSGGSAEGPELSCASLQDGSVNPLSPAFLNSLGGVSQAAAEACNPIFDQCRDLVLFLAF